MVPQSPSPGNPSSEQSGSLTLSHLRGTIVPSVQAELQPLLRAPAAEWLTGPDRELIKQTTVRAIARVRVGNLDVHVKLYRAGKLSDRARDALGGARGECERDNLQLARKLGLPAAEPLAAGVFLGDGDWRSFLITRTVAHAQAWSFASPATALAATGALLRHAHDLGCMPEDLHPGNVVLDENHSPWLLDLTTVRHRGSPNLTVRARALAFFCQELDGGPLDRRAEPLLTAYLAAGTPLPTTFRGKLRQAANEVRLRALAAFARRAGRECRHTKVEPGRRGQPWWGLHRSGDACRDERLHATARAFAIDPPTPSKAGRRGAVWLLPDLAVKQRAAAKARALFTAHYLLRFAHVPQAEPVALRELRGLGFTFATRLPGEDLAAELRRGPLPATAVLRAARSLGDSLGRLHAHGLRNRDLKFDNMVRDASTGIVRFVDLEGIHRKKPTDPRGQGNDLGRLLAAFRGAGAPGGAVTLRAFLRGYVRARRDLLQPGPMHRLLRTAELRARAWASAHRG